MFADRAKILYPFRQRRRRSLSASAENCMYQTAVRTAETADDGGDVIFEVDEGLNTLDRLPP